MNVLSAILGILGMAVICVGGVFVHYRAISLNRFTAYWLVGFGLTATGIMMYEPEHYAWARQSVPITLAIERG